ncbi:hypothetical protein FPRO04_08725 [Fusarium proliferatum]|nr:hypothetical protein FPRO03_02002 [Fusarium proliferatum]KAG4275063.1 hypothetical protein FPRO04_08725 [Fusarium proliferatum]
MSSSANDTRLSTGIQNLEDILQDIENYEDEVCALECLFEAYPDLDRTHHDEAKKVKDTIRHAFETIEKAKRFTNKALFPKLYKPWAERLKSSKLRSEEFRKLQKDMATNSEGVETLVRRLKRTIEPQLAREPSRASLDIYNPPRENRIPFTEPYDEDLCDF